jgi:hypothetical protein
MAMHPFALPPDRLLACVLSDGGLHASKVRDDGTTLLRERVYVREDIVAAEVQKRVAVIAASVRRRQENCAKAGDEGAFHILCALAEDLEGGQL